MIDKKTEWGVLIRAAGETERSMVVSTNFAYPLELGSDEHHCNR